MAKLRMAIVGGGPGSFIGRVHVAAATMDGKAELCAGVFSTNEQRNRQAGEDWFVDQARVYPDVETLIESELRLAADKRVQFVTVATPNDTHFPIASKLLSAGFHVFCDKPMTTSLADASALVEQAEAANRVFVVTHNYTGYPLIRLARRLIADGELGEVQAIRASYLQGWMRTRKPTADLPRGNWKFDPKRNGVAGTWGDIGVHAFNLIRFVTQLKPRELACHLQTCSAGGLLDDAGFGLLNMANGALATISASQVAHGFGNDLSLEVDGVEGSLRWRQEEPNQLFWRANGRPTRVLTRDPNAEYAGEVLLANCRTPAGLPEGFIEAFANLYRAGFDAIAAAQNKAVNHHGTEYPSVIDGFEGVKFIEASVASHRHRGAWQAW